MRLARFVLASLLAGCSGGGSSSMAISAPPVAPGTLDKSFGVAGIAVVEPATDRSSVAGSVAVDSEGRVIVAGAEKLMTPPVRSLLVRFTADGVPESSWPVGGQMQSVNRVGEYVIALQDGGTILGERDHVTTEFTLKRLDAHGVIDEKFGVMGSIAMGYGTALTSFGDGSFAVFGDAQESPLSGQRWDNGGRVVPAYLENSLAALDAVRGGRFAGGVKAIGLDDGRAIVGMNTDEGIVMARLLADGRLDMSYGSQGTVRLPIQENGIRGVLFMLVARPHGAVAAIGGRSGGGIYPTCPWLQIAWIDSEGNPEISRQGGALTTLETEFMGTVVSAVSQPDDRLLLVGFAPIRQNGYCYESSKFHVARLDATGKPDTTFGPFGQGWASLKSAGQELVPGTLALARDGSLYVAGSVPRTASVTGTTYSLAIAKLGS